MKSFLSAGLAGLLLSGASMAQGDWTFVDCSFDGVERLAGGKEERWSGATTFRFNAERAELFDPATGAWIHDCVEGDGYFGVQESVTDSEVRCSRAGTNEAGGELYFDRSIYRDTGRFTVADHSYGEGAERHGTAEGLCVTGVDPSADMEQD